jgi:hypothetical protein
MTLHNHIEDAEKELELIQVEKVAEEFKKMGLGYSIYFKHFSYQMMWLINNREKIIRNRKLIDMLG